MKLFLGYLAASLLASALVLALGVVRAARRRHRSRSDHPGSHPLPERDHPPGFAEPGRARRRRATGGGD